MASFELNVKLAFGLSVATGGREPRLVSGASTVHVWTAGVASARPETVCTARTSSVCWPSSRSSATYGDSQEFHEMSSGVGSGSSAHWKSGWTKSGATFRPGSLEVNWKFAVALGLGSDGACVSVVSGTTESVALTAPKIEKLSTISEQTV